jgi:hypothetical protein
MFQSLMQNRGHTPAADFYTLKMESEYTSERSKPIKLRFIISQKITFLIVTATRSSNRHETSFRTACEKKEAFAECVIFC